MVYVFKGTAGLKLALTVIVTDLQLIKHISFKRFSQEREDAQKNCYSNHAKCAPKKF